MDHVNPHTGKVGTMITKMKKFLKHHLGLRYGEEPAKFTRFLSVVFT